MTSPTSQDAARALLPCPFCGETRVSLNPPNKSINFKGSINCPSCLASMPREVSSDEDELIHCWNARANSHADTVQGKGEAVAWADNLGLERPIDAEAMKHLRNNPTTEVYWSRFSIPLYATPSFGEAKIKGLDREAHPGDHINLLKAVCGFCDIETIEKITTFVVEQRRSAIDTGGSQSSDGGGESRPATASGSGPLPTAHSETEVACSAIEPSNGVTSDGRQQEQKRTAGVAPGPSEATADAARMREALELSRKAIEQAICCVRGDTPEDCTDEEARNDTLSKLRDADGAIYAALAPADGEVKP